MSVIERRVTICNTRGLHARAAAKFVEMAQRFDAVVHVTREGETVPADSIMELLMLAASKGAEINIASEGMQAADASAALVELVEAGFHESE